MNCKYVEKKLSAFQDNSMPVREMLAVEKHLKSCSGCLRKYEELLQAWELLSEVESFNSAPFFWTRIAQQLADKKSVSTKRRLFFYPIQWSPVSILTIVLLVFALFTGIYFGKTIFQQTTSNQHIISEENFSELSTINAFDDYTSESLSEVYVSIISENTE